MLYLLSVYKKDRTITKKGIDQSYVQVKSMKLFIGENMKYVRQTVKTFHKFMTLHLTSNVTVNTKETTRVHL
jgi:predicted transcriptional regulator